MTLYSHRLFLILCVIGLLALLHMFVHNNLFSFVMFPLALAAVLPYTYASSLTLTLGLLIIAELFAGLPPGVMTLVVITPLIMRRFFPHTEIDISARFFTLIASTVALQLLVILATLGISLRIEEDMAWTRILMSLPWISAGISWLATSGITYILSIAWRDITPPDVYTPPPKLKT